MSAGRASGTQRTLCITGRTLSYTLVRKRVKNVNLRVRPDGRVFVSASPGVPTALIDAFVLSRGDFLLRALDSVRPRQEPAWTEGRTLYYLGRPVRLLLAAAPRRSVRLDGEFLLVCLRSPGDGESVRRAVMDWYREESERLCRDCFARLYPQYAALGVPLPEIRMRAMRSCWGNCRPQRRVVTFNSLLAAADGDCIEYVVAHELTHFLHADHSRAFYAALARVIPDWKPRRARLKALAPLLFS